MARKVGQSLQEFMHNKQCTSCGSTLLRGSPCNVPNVRCGDVRRRNLGTGNDPTRGTVVPEAPSLFSVIPDMLKQHVSRGNGWQRVVVEKPFGHDLASASQLNTELTKFVKERQIYRIDHYLGKETVQNILMFRFSNSIFERLWNRDSVDHVQITVSEKIGVGDRVSPS